MADGAAFVKEPRILVRPLQKAAEMCTGAELQRRVWAYSEIESAPEQKFIVAKESGGQILGASHESQAIGFDSALVGVHRGKVYLDAHMVGVVPGYQGWGTGRIQKLAQQDDAVERGIDLIRWTLDPRQLKNADSNLARLRAFVRRCISNVYGRTSSLLHAGLTTHRLIAEWWIRSAQVRDLLSGGTDTPGPDGARISIPAAIGQICSSDSSERENIQSRVQEQFDKYVADGRTAVGFKFDEQQDSCVAELYED
jgi:predicted GNAT superfamily acetyltransferase